MKLKMLNFILLFNLWKIDFSPFIMLLIEYQWAKSPKNP